MDADSLEGEEKLEMGKRPAKPGYRRRTIKNDDTKRPKIDQIGKESDNEISDNASAGPSTSFCLTGSKFKVQNDKTNVRRNAKTSSEIGSGASVASGGGYLDLSYLNNSSSTSSQIDQSAQ